MFNNSPLEFIDNLFDNKIYIKREDKLPFSYGGNKVRFAEAFLKDMNKKGKNALIAYGSKSSNLCRVLAQMCYDNQIPCAVVYSESTTSQTNNSRLVTKLNVREYLCDKTSVAETIGLAVKDFEQQGLNPYYIYGNTKGEGNELVPISSYMPVYDEILDYEKAIDISFDYIFLATGTAATYSGLMCRALELSHNRNIIGISVARDRAKCSSIVKNNLNLYFNENINSTIDIYDNYLLGGYGRTSKEELQLIDHIFHKYNIPLDPTYTGKAFFGMKDFLAKHNIKNKNILFIHTGGYPIFCDYKGIRL